MKTFFKIIGAILFFLLLAGVSLKLFLPDLLSDWQKKITDAIQKTTAEDKTLTIAYSDNLSSLEPTLYDVSNRKRLINIYEGLVKIGKNLNVESGLAVSWGMLNDTTWEFTLRPNVMFHDKTSFTADDVKASLDRALNYSGSQVKNLISSIKEVKVINQKKIEIYTENPDPLLLNKLASVYIFPAAKEKTIDQAPVGTGPYKLMTKENNLLKIGTFPEYWGEKPVYRYVILKYIQDKDERISELLNKRADILDSVPTKNVPALNKYQVKVYSKPSLEINFLAFNLQGDKNNIWRNLKIRQALKLALDRQFFLTYAKNYAQLANQFVSREIFGYNPAIKYPDINLDEAKKIVKEVEPVFRLKTTLDLLQGLETFGNYLQKTLQDLAIDVELKYHSTPDSLYKTIKDGSTSFFFLGWRSELGDSGDFLQTFIHSRTKDERYGELNGSFYQSDKVDKLIEESDSILQDPAKRMEKLQEVMRIIAEEDIVGIPLFETSVIYGVSPLLNWEPRVDGYIFAAEVK